LGVVWWKVHQLLGHFPAPVVALALVQYLEEEEVQLLEVGTVVEVSEPLEVVVHHLALPVQVEHNSLPGDKLDTALLTSSQPRPNS